LKVDRLIAQLRELEERVNRLSPVEKVFSVLRRASVFRVYQRLIDPRERGAAPGAAGPATPPGHAGEPPSSSRSRAA
jgi:hypothetical protein